jgi:hypothetical protein
MLWLAQGSGDLNTGAVLHPGPSLGFVRGIRSLLPFAAANLALAIIIFKLARHRSQGTLFFGPLGLSVLYGGVGVFASFLSPNGLAALYWAAAYLSVPVVLWAIAWGPAALVRLQRLVNITWMFIVLLTVLLFAIALLELNLGKLLANPSALLTCEREATGQWTRLTSGLVRSTGVGRYAAIAGIVALGGLWQGSWRIPWGLVLVGSLIMLLFTSSRTAIIGFAVAVPFVVFLSGGKKALIGGAATVVIMVPIFWTTGVHNTFLDSCIFRVPLPDAGSATAQVPAVPPPQDGTTQPDPDSTDPPPQDGTTQPDPDSTDPPPQDGTTQPDQDSTVTPLQGGTAQTQESASIREEESPDDTKPSRISEKFRTLTGRTAVWKEALKLFEDSPLLGRGFHADRLLLNAHTHNSYVHALLQTGILGTLPFVASLMFGWFLILKALRNLNRFTVVHKHIIIQTSGLMAFLSFRTITESTGAFFGIDWLLLAPLLLYLQVVNRDGSTPPDQAMQATVQK